MGQYHRIVNLTKRERIDPHVFGQGLKQYEQFSGLYSEALYVLLVAPVARGGGDFPDDPTGVKGRWHGDRIAVIGDYAEDYDIPDVPEAPRLYGDIETDDGRVTETCTDISELVRTYLIGQIHEGGYIITSTDGWQQIHESCPHHKDKFKLHGGGACALLDLGKEIEWWDGYAGRINAREFMT